MFACELCIAPNTRHQPFWILIAAGRCVGHDRFSSGLSVCQQLVCPGWGWRCLALLFRAHVALRRSRGEPSSAHREQRLSERLTLARAIPCADTGMRDHAEKEQRVKANQNDAAKKPKKCIFACAPTRSAASRAGMAGWAGRWGRFGERRV